MNEDRFLINLSFLCLFICLFGGLFFPTEEVKAFDNSYVVKYVPIPNVPDEFENDSILWSIGGVKLQEEYVYLFSSKGVNYTTIELQFKVNYNRYELHYKDENQLTDIVVFSGYEDSLLFYDSTYYQNVFVVLGSWYDLNYSVIKINDLSVFESYSSDELGYYYNNNVSKFISLGDVISYSLEDNYILDFNLIDFNTNILGCFYLGEFFYNNEYYKYLQFYRNDENNIIMKLIKDDTRKYLSFNLSSNEDINNLKENFFTNRSYITNSNYELDTIITFTNKIEDVNNWTDFIESIINVPIIYLSSLLNFNILGFNLWLVLTSILTFILVLYIIKRFV